MDNRPYYTDLEWTIQCLELRQTWQRRRAPTPNQAWPSQEADNGPISSLTPLQPNQSLQVVLCHLQKNTSFANHWWHSFKTGSQHMNQWSEPASPSNNNSTISRKFTGTLCSQLTFLA
jgi:hypothetical protein